MTGLEIAANAVMAASILLAARNSVHTWWTGIIGCSLFGFLFWHTRLYADVLLQAHSRQRRRTRRGTDGPPAHLGWLAREARPVVRSASHGSRADGSAPREDRGWFAGDP